MVITDVNQVVYQGDGATTAFPFTFRIIDATDIKLLLIDADGTETDITSDYFVDTVNNTVHYPGYAPGAEPGLADRPAPVQEGQRLVVYRELPVTQEKDLGEKWPFFVIELALDKLTMLIQQVKGIWDRCLKVSVGQEATAPDFNYTVPIEAGKTFRVKDDGTGFELTEDPAVAHEAAVAAQEAAERAQGIAEEARDDAEAAAANAEDALDLIKEKATWFDNVAAMKAATGLQVGMLAGTKGYYAINDGGSSIYAIRAKTQDDVDDGENILVLNNGKVAEKIYKPFMALNMHDAINIPNYSDLNDYKTAGTYYTQHSANSLTIKNIPPFKSYLSGFRLAVSYLQRDSVILQEFFTNTLQKYFRTFDDLPGRGWTDWEEYATRKSVAHETGVISPIKVGLDCAGIQDAAYHDGKLFVFYGNKKMRVFDWDKKEEIGLYDVAGSITSHANTLTFGHKQNDSDAYPLLYSSGYNGKEADGTTTLPQGTCQVYKINADYSTDFIQDIRIGFINNALWKGNGTVTGNEQFGEFVVDNDNNLLYVIQSLVEDGVPKTRFFKFAIPDTSYASVSLMESDILDYFDIPYHPVHQGATYHDGYIYLSSGLNDNPYYNLTDCVYVSKIDLTNKKEVWAISLNNIMSEAEGVVCIDGKLYVGQNEWYELYGIDVKVPSFASAPYISTPIPSNEKSKKIATTEFVANNFLPLTGGTMTAPIRNTTDNGTPYIAQFNNIKKGVASASTVNRYFILAQDLDAVNLNAISVSVYTNGNKEMRFISEWSHGQIFLAFQHYLSENKGEFAPYPSNVCTLGSASRLWSQLYAATTTISTSDERLKNNITDIPDEVLDAWGEVGWYQYQFKDSIAEKGETKARIHTGAIAQRIESVFTAHGLDANKYGLLCYDEWQYEPAERDEQGNIVQPARPAGNRYSLRYEEALCMEAAYQRRRADKLEERIARLEAKL